jgi:hypothetical protein
MHHVWTDLPQSLRSIPDLILEKTGIEVEVLPKELCDATFIDVEKAVAIADVNGSEQRVVIWCDQQTITSSVMGHELIHLRRDICEEQLKVTPAKRSSPGFESMIHLMENEIEHIFVIPEELHHFPDAEARWAAVYDGVVEGIITRDPLDRIETALAWMQLRNSLPEQMDLARKLGAHIKTQGSEWVQECEAFRIEAKVAKDENDKSILVRWIAKAINTWYPQHTESVVHCRWEVTEAGLNYTPLGTGLIPE